MKTTTISVVAMVTVFALAAVFAAQSPGTVRAAGNDLLGGLVGDMVRFERGMRTLDEILSKNPNDLEAKVLHGNGVMARAGEAFKVGDSEKAIQLWQSGLDEMAQAVDAAPDNLFVRARRGVFMITASRNAPPVMAKPLLETAVEDFGRVLQIREREHSLAERSVHQRGELLTSLADGWDRLGDKEKARGYFERITKDLKGTIYEQRANAWLENKPEAKAPDFFACSGCHVE
jgi:tetratricopeptide (TPR) repeat protein